jgi:hypothetical protein
MRAPKVYCHTCLDGISCFPLPRSATTLLPLPLVVVLAMATPPPGFVCDLADAFDQAGAPVTAPSAGVAPAQPAVAAAAPPPMAPVPPPLPPPPSAVAPVPLAAGFFMPLSSRLKRWPLHPLRRSLRWRLLLPLMRWRLLLPLMHWSASSSTNTFRSCSSSTPPHERSSWPRGGSSSISRKNDVAKKLGLFDVRKVHETQKRKTIKIKGII